MSNLTSKSELSIFQVARIRHSVHVRWHLLGQILKFFDVMLLVEHVVRRKRYHNHGAILQPCCRLNVQEKLPRSS